jgi:hypothetical protein
VSKLDGFDGFGDRKCFAASREQRTLFLLAVFSRLDIPIKRCPTNPKRLADLSNCVGFTGIE